MVTNAVRRGTQTAVKRETKKRPMRAAAPVYAIPTKSIFRSLARK